MSSRLRIWIMAARPKTLWAAVAPVLIGTALAFADGVFHGGAALVALLGAALIQIGTNFVNDYADFKKGADTETRKGPVRVTQAGFVTPTAVKRASLLVFGTAFLLGLYLVVRAGWPLLVVGLASILCGLWYTVGRYSLAYLGLGDLFVLIFFGPVAVGGTYYVQALALSPLILIVGLAPGLLAVAILVVNNLRDVNEDRAVGKKTLVVRFGRGFGRGLYVFCLVIAALIPVGVYWETGTHPGALSAVLILPLAWPAIRAVFTHTDATLNATLAHTARLLLIYSVLFSVGWIL